jgi:hypothetical protein
MVWWGALTGLLFFEGCLASTLVPGVPAHRVSVPGRTQLLDPAHKPADRCVNRCTDEYHGRCSMDLAEVCTCFAPYLGGAADCSQQACPTGVAWADYPDANQVAHRANAECSNAGYCDRSTGSCICDRRYEGDACQRLKCPRGCYGHGRCLTMREAAVELNGDSLFNKVRYEKWDADKLTGCVCDEGWSGFDCSLRSCPAGSDPLSRGVIETQTIRSTATQVREVQRVVIDAVGGSNDDEIQRFHIYVDAGLFVEGMFGLRFDTSGGACAFCTVEADCTVAISIARNNALLTQDRTLAQLETCTNIGTGSIQVSVTPWTGTVASVAKEGFRFQITFTGADVGGDVPRLQLMNYGLYGRLPDLSIAPVANPGISCQEASIADCEVDGDEVSGTLYFTHDDTTNVAFSDADNANYPSVSVMGLTPRGLQGPVAVPVQSKPSDIKLLLEGLSTIGSGTLTVSRTVSGGAGVTWFITWSGSGRGAGNKAQLVISTNAVTAPAPATPTVAISTLAHGTWIIGTFSIGVQYDSAVALYSATLNSDVSAASVDAAIEAIDDAIGTVDVTRSQHIGTYGWFGGYEWVITFRSVAENLPTLSITSSMDADMGVAGTSDAAITVVADTKNFETQAVATTVSHQNEIHRVTITHPSDTADEVQRIDMYISGGGPPTGYFRLGLDTTTGCNRCPVNLRASYETINIAIPNTGTLADQATALAVLVKSRLELMGGVDSVTVSGETYPSSASPSATDFGYTLRVTFSGTNVGGNVPLLTFTYSDGTPSAWTTAVTEEVAGGEVQGTVTLQFSDLTGWPKPSQQPEEGLSDVGAVTTGPISVFASATDIKNAIDAISIVGTVTVSTTTTGGPGVVWDVTFSGGVRGRGYIALPVCDTASLTPAGATCTSTETQRGTFLTGTFQLRQTYGNVLRTSSNIQWDATADEVAAAVALIYPDNLLGTVVASRSKRYLTGNNDDWSGSFTWTITFTSLTDDLPAFKIISGLSALDGVVGDGGADIELIAAANLDGSALGEVNEVQLIECKCLATCSGSVVLAWKEGLSSAIAHDSTAATLRTALLTIPGMLGVSVSMAGGTQMCDADGVTTAVTFTHFAGNAPPLHVPWTVAGSFAIESSAGDVEFGIREGGQQPRGNHGFKVKQGTRNSKPCSGRGVCDFSTGLCTCSNTGTGGSFTASNGAGGETNAQTGTIDNCGFPNSISNCPMVSALSGTCSGHGTCSSDNTYLCLCNTGYTGPTCSEKTCPKSRAWFDEATLNNKAHGLLNECASKGHCNRDVGTCSCDTGLEEDDCSKSACPFAAFETWVEMSQKTSGCGGNNCTTMRGLADHAVDTATGELISGAKYEDEWDADMMQGCACPRFMHMGPLGRARGNYTGPDCSRRSCPASQDPKHPDRFSRVHEKQTFTCSATEGQLRFQFLGKFSPYFDYNAFVLDAHKTSDSESLESALSRLLSLTKVRVTLSPTTNPDGLSDSDKRVCTTSQGKLCCVPRER